MSSKCRPWYRWYPKDFIGDEKVRALSPMAELMYRRMLDASWESSTCKLPDDIEYLNRLLGKGISSSEFKKAWHEIQYPGREILESFNGEVWSKRLFEQFLDCIEKSGDGADAAFKRWKSSGNRENKIKRSERLAAARKKAKHTKEEWANMLEFFDNSCVCCEIKKKQTVKGRVVPLYPVKDHIIPIYQEGSDGIRNLQPMCRSCNSSKGADNTDYRLIYCIKNKIKMPTEWLPNAYGNAFRTPAE